MKKERGRLEGGIGALGWEEVGQAARGGGVQEAETPLCLGKTLSQVCRLRLRARESSVRREGLTGSRLLCGLCLRLHLLS